MRDAYSFLDLRDQFHSLSTMRKKIFLLACCFSLFAASLRAQPYIDIVNVQYQQFLKTPYTNSPEMNLFTGEWTASVTLPLVLKNKDIILIGASYDQLILQSNEGSATTTTRLHVPALQLGYLRQWKNEKWSTLFFVLPKISSDFTSLSGDDYQAGGLVLMNYKKNKKIKYHFGIYYNQEYFGPFFIPLLGLDWKVSPKINIFGILPSTANFEYKFNKILYAGASYKSITASYRLGDGTFLRDGGKLGHNQIKVYVNLYATKNIVFYAETGYTFLRSYHQYDADNELLSVNPVYESFKDGWLFNVGISYRVRTDEDEK